MATPDELKQMIEAEVARLDHPLVVANVRELLVEPRAEQRLWGFGETDASCTCWVVLDHPAGSAGVGHCASGFPGLPWGFLPFGKGRHARTMGTAETWHPTFLDAYFDTWAPANLPIWRVAKDHPNGRREWLTEQSNWEDAWTRVRGFQFEDSEGDYTCATDVWPRNG